MTNARKPPAQWASTSSTGRGQTFFGQCAVSMRGPKGKAHWRNTRHALFPSPGLNARAHFAQCRAFRAIRENH